MLSRSQNLFPFWKESVSSGEDNMQNELLSLGLYVDPDTGHLFYTNEFKPLNLNFELIFIRHGETFGNCGQCLPTGEIDRDMVEKGIKNRDKRIYQGNVDGEINQLTEYGKLQAS